MEPNNVQPEPNRDPIPTQYNTPIQNMVEDSKRDSKIGPLVGSIVIIVLMLIAALYFWGSIVAEKKADMQNPPVQRQDDTMNLQGSVNADL